MIFYDPVAAPDGHIYEKEALYRHLTLKATSPLTNTPMYLRQCYHELCGLKSTIDEFIINNPEYAKDRYVPFKIKYSNILKDYNAIIALKEQEINDFFSHLYSLRENDQTEMIKKIFDNVDVTEHIINCVGFTFKVQTGKLLFSVALKYGSNDSINWIVDRLIIYMIPMRCNLFVNAFELFEYNILRLFLMKIQIVRPELTYVLCNYKNDIITKITQNRKISLYESIKLKMKINKMIKEENEKLKKILNKETI
jgi:hypothetical protein